LFEVQINTNVLEYIAGHACASIPHSINFNINTFLYNVHERTKFFIIDA